MALPRPDPEPIKPFFSSLKVAPEPALATPPAPATRGPWDELIARVTAHFLFAGSVALFMLAAFGLDALIARRRRLLRALDER